jgi:hypothetical protein
VEIIAADNKASGKALGSGTALKATSAMLVCLAEPLLETIVNRKYLAVTGVNAKGTAGIGSP